MIKQISAPQGPIPIRPTVRSVVPNDGRYFTEAYTESGRWLGKAQLYDSDSKATFFDASPGAVVKSVRVYWGDQSRIPERFDVAILFGELNPEIRRRRTIALANLHKEGDGRFLHFVLVGTATEVQVMTNILLKAGIPQEEITAIGRSINTIDNVYYSMQALQGLDTARTVALMTGCYEMERARQAWIRLKRTELPDRQIDLTLLSTQDAISAGRTAVMQLMLATNSLQLDMYTAHRDAFRAMERKLRGLKGPFYVAQRQ